MFYFKCHCDVVGLLASLFGFPKEVQMMVKDLPFEGMKLFAEKTVSSLYTLKDSRAPLRSPVSMHLGTKEGTALSDHSSVAHNTPLNTHPSFHLNIHRDCMNLRGRSPGSPDERHRDLSKLPLSPPPQRDSFDGMVEVPVEHSSHFTLGNPTHPFGDSLAPFHSTGNG